MNKRVLLAEDDVNLGFVIQDNLSRKGYEIVLCSNGEDAQHSFMPGKFDLCILDVMLPKKDGFALAQEIRKKDLQVPILFVTARGMVEDRIAGFNAGADDYIVKPFSMEELCLRMEVFLRRSAAASVPGDQPFPLGNYHFDFRNLRLCHAEGDKVLTQKEADVLRLLCLNKERVLKREEILKNVWGDDDYFMGRSLDVFISKLRKYLKTDPSVQITNFHGVGFKLEIRS